jgi:hypothetical protein
MPQSKQRKEGKQHTHIDYIPHKKKKKSAVPVAIVVCVLLALGIAWFAAGSYAPAMAAAVVLGSIVGWIAGMQMDKTFNK